jgi:hypothetical protein
MRTRRSVVTRDDEKKPAIGLERLRTLYAVMHGLPDERVNLMEWRRLNYRSSPGIKDTTLLYGSCGTVACAVGWACAYPAFKKQGLAYDGLGPTYKQGLDKYYDWVAVKKFFEVSDEEASYLFTPVTLSHPGKLEPKSSIRKNETHRQKVLRRIRVHLVYWGVITEERSDELAALE